MRALVKRWVHQAKPHLRWVWPWIFRLRELIRRVPVQKIPISSKYFGRPKGVYWSTDEYLASPAGQREANSRYDIHPGETIRLPLPATLDGEVHWKFRQNQVQEVPPARVYALGNARFWGHFGATILSADDFLINDLSRDLHWGPEHRVFSKFKLPRCRRLAGTVAVLATAEAASNYWHWTLELLPKLHLLEKAGFPPEKVDFYLVNHTGQPYQLETLAELGIRPEQIIRTDAGSHFEADRLLVFPVKAQFQIARWTCDFLRSLAPQTAPTRRRRLYISREHATFRRLLNESEVFAALEPLGFGKVYCERLGVREQRQLFHEAEIIVAPHGAALTNLVYCAPGTRIVELFPPAYVDLSMWPHISHRQLQHSYLLGEGDVAPEGIDPAERTQDFTVDVRRLEQLIDSKISRTHTPAHGNAEHTVSAS